MIRHLLLRAAEAVFMTALFVVCVAIIWAVRR